jgi:hypothetical protein
MAVWVLYLVQREMNQFIRDRHDFLTSKEHASLAQSKTVLLTGIPKDYLTIDTLKKFTSYLPGGAKNIWIARSVSEVAFVFDIIVTDSLVCVE